MSERYPDDYWLADFERRLSDGRLLTREESLGLITELRRVRLEYDELRAALEPLQSSSVSTTPRHVQMNGFMTCRRSATVGRAKAQPMRCAPLYGMCAGELSSSGRS
jgi:hypothetical protein